MVQHEQITHDDIVSSNVTSTTRVKGLYNEHLSSILYDAILFVQRCQQQQIALECRMMCESFIHLCSNIEVIQILKCWMIKRTPWNRVLFKNLIVA
jgi:hypothetical protein